MSPSLSSAIFRAGQHYAGVTMQQGRVQLDADVHDDAPAAESDAAAGPDRHYAGVTLQQGTPQLDTDASHETPSGGTAEGPPYRALLWALARWP